MIKDDAIEELFEKFYADEDFIKLLSMCADNRDVSGLADIIVGTHAVIQQGVVYNNLGLVIANGYGKWI